MNLSSINDSYTTTFNEVDFERNTSNQSVAAMNYDNIVFVHCYPALCIDRIITPIWYIVGITGNIMAAVVWLQPRMRRNSSSAIYLSALSINDTLFLLLHPIQELKYAWFQRSVDYPVICESFALVFLVTQYMAPLLVLCFTVDRYLAVCYPFKKKVLCSASRAVKVVAGVGIGCLSVGSIQPYFWTYDATSTACQVRENVQVGGDRSLWSVWTWATEMLIFMVVPLIILAVNLRVIHEIYRISDRSINPMSTRQTGAAATNAMLLSVSFYVIATVLPATIVYTLAVTFPEGSYDLASHEAVSADPVWNRHFVYFYFKRIVDEICLSHYACNFFLFALTGKKFRAAAVNTLLCRKIRPDLESNSCDIKRRNTDQQSTLFSTSTM